MWGRAGCGDSQWGSRCRRGASTRRRHANAAIPQLLPAALGAQLHAPSTSYTLNIARSLSSRLALGRNGASRPCASGGTQRGLAVLAAAGAGC